VRVRFEPIGEEIEVEPEETVLDAAFRQGYNLVYGCREGQCSACKCFLLEGDATLKPYSTFALSDSERANGYSLMCRAMPDQDLVVELLHYDPDAYRLEHAIRTGTATVEAVEPLTRDIVRLVLQAPEFEFTPGQYVDLHVPGAPGVKRSFSMANLPGEGRIELIIKRYEGGRFSALLDGSGLKPGDAVEFTGPYGSLRIRESERPILMIAGGSGMAPILSLLRGLARDGCARPVRFFYGARSEEDLFAVEEIERLGESLGDFRFVPVVGGFVHEAVDEELEQPDVYMCGPPPMVEAAEAMLARRGIDEQRIFVDKFTTSADAAAEAPVEAGGAAALLPASERDFTWYIPAGRRATLYEDVTVDTQPSVHRHLNRGWPVSFEDGRGTWDDGSTALRSSDWFAFRDPGQQWERPFYQAGTATEHQIEGALRNAAEEGLLSDFQPEWVAFLRQFLQVPAYVEHGLWFALATIARDCLSDTVATCVCLQAAMKQRSAQAIVLYAMDLERHHGDFPISDARETFLRDPAWQPTRQYLERLAATRDWGEVVVAANLCFEPVVGTLIRRELGIRAAAAAGDTVTPVLARVASQEWSWARAWTEELVRFLVEDPANGSANREVIDAWVADWRPQAVAAAQALPVEVDLERVLADEPRLSPRPAQRRRRAPKPGPAPSQSAATVTGDGYDYVGIVMARSAEGDAVAEVLRRREGVEVIEQPSFWDIRAVGRLAVPYAEVSEALGYEVDAYSMQHEMSTHYGRLIATDEALMLFSDPTEAMEHLLS
jgi:propane monooxygenase reductase subunit